MGPPMTTRNQYSRRFTAPPIETLLGGISARRFFRDYWQKKPLLVRQAVPGLERILDGQGLIDLACREDAESRLVRPVRGNWRLRHGPFAPAQLASLPRRNWSLLVSGVNMLIPAGDTLLNAFNFAPYARLDDLMVSFAPPGGGVGPHFDSYDVFLIQGLGRRRWEISGQDDLELIDNCPLRLLKRFRVDQSWELEPGDMLYLPPKYAHNGIALSHCMTWSIGFRAPTAQEMTMAFLAYLQDNLHLTGLYADPDLTAGDRPGEIPPLMARRLKTMIRNLRWGDAELEDFLGRYLSEPKPQVFFDPPVRPAGLTRFRQAVHERGVCLDARTRMLYRHDAVFMNGERIAVVAHFLPLLQQLADRRRLPGGDFEPALVLLLHEWYGNGYLHPGGA